MSQAPFDAAALSDLLTRSIRDKSDLLTSPMRKSLVATVTEDLVARSDALPDASFRLAASMPGTRWVTDQDEAEWHVLKSVFQARRIETDWSMGAPEALRQFLNSQYPRGRISKVANSSDGALILAIRARTMEQAVSAVYDMLTPDEQDFWYQTPKTIPAVLFRLPIRSFEKVLDSDGSAIVASVQIWVIMDIGEQAMLHMFFYWEPKSSTWLPLQMTCRAKECVTWH